MAYNLLHQSHVSQWSAVVERIRDMTSLRMSVYETCQKLITVKDTQAIWFSIEGTRLVSFC